MAYTFSGKSIKQITEALAQGLCDQAGVIACFTERMNREDKGPGYKARYTRAIQGVTQGVADPVKFAFTNTDATPTAKPKAKAKAPAKAPANPFDGLSKDHAQMVMAFASMLRAKK